ncbi:MAG: hypothetical protein ACFCVE_11385 [Phycisphaerae bacterium]
MPTFFGVLEHRRVLSADPAGVSEADVLAASQEAYEVVVVDQTATLDVRMTEVSEAVAVVEAFANADIVPSAAVLTAMIDLFEATTTLSADTEVDAATRAELDLLIADLSIATETLMPAGENNGGTPSESEDDGASGMPLTTTAGNDPPRFRDLTGDGVVSNADMILVHLESAAWYAAQGYFEAAWYHLKQIPSYF